MTEQAQPFADDRVDEHVDDQVDNQVETQVDDGVDGAVRTGAPEVDRVLAEVEGLGDRPLAEHLGVYERAHESLRSALDARPDQSA